MARSWSLSSGQLLHCFVSLQVLFIETIIVESDSNGKSKEMILYRFTGLEIRIRTVYQFKEVWINDRSLLEVIRTNANIVKSRFIETTK